MSLLKRIFAAVLNLAEEVASHIVEEVKIAVDATSNAATMDRKDALNRGRTKLAAFAKREGFDYDPNSVNDTFKLLKERVFVHDEYYSLRSVDDLKRDLAKEMRIADYTMTAEQNDKLRSELQIMVGYGDLVLER